MPLTIGTRRALLRGGKAYTDKALGYGPIAYWPLYEKSGSAAACLVNSAQNGSYTGATLGQPGFGDGNTAPLFDGVNDYVTLTSATLFSNFSSEEGSIAIWMKSAGPNFWDNQFRCGFIIQQDANNYVTLDTNNIVNTWRWERKGAGAADGVTAAIGGIIGTDQFHVALTWSKSASETIAYLNGSQQGAVQGYTSDWVGAPVASLIASYDPPPTNPRNCYAGHAAVWDRALTPAEIAALAVV